jgi:hypothetical protein
VTTRHGIGTSSSRFERQCREPNGWLTDTRPCFDRLHALLPTLYLQGPRVTVDDVQSLYRSRTLAKRPLFALKHRTSSWSSKETADAASGNLCQRSELIICTMHLLLPWTSRDVRIIFQRVLSNKLLVQATVPFKPTCFSKPFLDAVIKRRLFFQVFFDLLIPWDWSWFQYISQ